MNTIARKVANKIREFIVRFVTPIRRCHKNKLKEKLKIQDFTLLTNNCAGGIIYHDLGLRFDSPTINLYFTVSDFLTFVENLSEFEDGILIKKEDSSIFPIGMLKSRKSDKCITIYFMHYHTWEEAKSSWIKRIERIHKDRIAVLIDANCGLSEDNMERFNKLVYHKKLLIPREYHIHKAENIHLMNCYNKEDNTGKSMMYRMHGMGIKRYIEEFDYVMWLNKMRYGGF